MTRWTHAHKSRKLWNCAVYVAQYVSRCHSCFWYCHCFVDNVGLQRLCTRCCTTVCLEFVLTPISRVLFVWFVIGPLSTVQQLSIESAAESIATRFSLRDYSRSHDQDGHQQTISGWFTKHSELYGLNWSIQCIFTYRSCSVISSGCILVIFVIQFRVVWTRTQWRSVQYGETAISLSRGQSTGSGHLP